MTSHAFIVLFLKNRIYNQFFDDNDNKKVWEVIMKSNGRGMVIIISYILTMLLISLVAIFTIRNTAKKPYQNNKEEGSNAITEIIYIPVYAEPESESDEITYETEKKMIYTVKTCEEKIGIFVDGELLYMLDVYIKTLPKADRILLEEGIVVHSESDLREIIEDYSS